MSIKIFLLILIIIKGEDSLQNSEYTERFHIEGVI